MVQRTGQNRCRERTGRWFAYFVLFSFLFIALFSSPTSIYAAENQAERVAILEKGDSRWLSTEIAVLDQLPENATLEQAMAHFQSGNFRWNGEGNISYGFDRQHLWIALNYQSNQTDVNPIIEVGYATLDYLRAYIYDPAAKSTTKVIESGDQMPFDQRPLTYRNLLIPLESTNQSNKTLFIQVDTQGAMKVPLRLADQSTFFNAMDKEIIFDGIYFGSVFVILLINLMYFLTFRKSIYLIYAFYLIVFALFVASYRGYGTSLLWTDRYVFIQWSTALFAFLSCATLVFFSVNFLRLKEYFPRFTKGLVVLGSLIFILTLVMWFLPYSRMLKFVSELTLIVSILMTVVGFLRFRSYAPARLFLLAFVFFFASVTVLSAIQLKLLPSYQWAEYAVEFGSLIQNILLLLALSDAIRAVQREKEASDLANLELQQRNQEQLQAYNRDLSLKVQEKTSSIQQLLDHSTEGFFTVDEHLKIGREYSAECRRLFGSPFAERQVVEILEPDDTFQQKFLLNVFLDLFKTEDSFQRDVLRTLLPEQLERNGFIVRLRYKWVEKVGNQPAHLLAIATDITNELRLKGQMEAERLRFEMVIQVFSHTEEFVEIMQSVETMLSNELLGWVTYAFEHVDTYQECFRTVHTLKGNASQMKLKELSEALHQLEDQIVNRKWRGDPFKLLTNAWEKDLSVIHEWLGDKITKQDSIVTIERKMLIELRNKLVEHPSPWSADLIAMLNRHLNKTIQDMLSMYPAFVERVAQSLDKWVHPLKVEGETVWIEPERLQFFVKSLVHVFRNMIDHGVEQVDERLEMGKSEVGTIRCRIEEVGDGFRLTISDDGRGMNPDWIRNKAVQKGLISFAQAEKLNAQECLQLVWLDGFSTRDFVTEISGRGIGLAAVKAELDRIGGQVQVESTHGKGSTFIFEVPNVVVQLRPVYQ